MTKAAAPPSLRRRVLWLVLALIALVSVLQAMSAYRSALFEADRMFDYHLQEVARSVHGGIPFAPGADISDYSVQVWGPDGTELYRSRGLQLPAQAVLGFSDSRVNGVRLRIYTLQTPEHTIQIAQDLDAREARARALAANAVMPIVLLAPLLMLAVGWVISDTLGPLRRMRKQVAQRAASDRRRSVPPACPRKCSRWWASSTRCSAACARPSRRSSISWPMRPTSCARRSPR
jgi:two-component system OmpR family sensor kinase